MFTLDKGPGIEYKGRVFGKLSYLGRYFFYLNINYKSFILRSRCSNVSNSLIISTDDVRAHSVCTFYDFYGMTGALNGANISIYFKLNS
jgi:hypothetical protein